MSSQAEVANKPATNAPVSLVDWLSERLSAVSVLPQDEVLLIEVRENESVLGTLPFDLRKLTAVASDVASEFETRHAAAHQELGTCADDPEVERLSELYGIIANIFEFDIRSTVGQWINPVTLREDWKIVCRSGDLKLSEPTEVFLEIFTQRLAAIELGETELDDYSEVAAGEETIGEFGESIQKLHALSGQIMAEGRAMVEKSEDGNDDPELNRYQRLSELISEVMWYEVRHTASAWYGGLGVRKGFKIVRLPPKPRSRIRALVIGLDGV